MGQSATAKLFFGYKFKEKEEDYGEPPEFEADEDISVEKVLSERGIADPWKEMPDFRNMGLRYEQQNAKENAWVAEHRAEIDAWHAMKNDLKVELGIGPVEFEYVGSGDYSYPVIAVKESVTRSYWGELPEIKNIDSKNTWVLALEKFVDLFDEFGPEDLEGPGWFLGAYYG